MEEPTTPYGRALLEKVSEEIKRSELGSNSDQLLFAPISRKVFEVYKGDPKRWDLHLASTHDGMINIILTARDHEAHY